MMPRTPNPFFLTTADLAPADVRSHAFDFNGFSVAQITSPQHLWFERAYATLWDEFGTANEMETRDVLAARMAWRPEEPAGGYAMQYAMTALLYEGQFAAVRDHTAIVDRREANAPAIVHLSHVLIAEAFRGTGLAGWMRALPLRTARECVARAGVPARAITLVAEMEPPLAGDVARTRRLAAYEKGGFTKIDPAVAPYRQPDFRPPAAIDADTKAGSGARPVPLELVVRRVGREGDPTLPASEVRGIVAALHAMYARTFRLQDMLCLLHDVDALPAAAAPVALLPPTAISSGSINKKGVAG